MNTNFEQLYQDLKLGIGDIAKQSFQDYLKEAKASGESALAAMKTDLQRWAQEVETGALTKDDLEFLLQEEAALQELTALKQAGISEIRVDQFRNAVVTAIVGTLTSLVKI
jgi:hypothetical protein